MACKDCVHFEAMPGNDADGQCMWHRAGLPFWARGIENLFTGAWVDRVDGQHCAAFASPPRRRISTSKNYTREVRG